jgi:drug/metabolite transporter (DMT)-like permease
MTTTIPPAPASDTASDKGAENLRGALIMMASMAGFIVNDVFMRSVMAELSLWQASFLRGCLLTAALAALAAWQGALTHRLSGKDARIVFWRCVGEIGGLVTFMLALMQMPLASLSAILQALPLAITLAAALFMGAPIGWRRMTAIVIGFAGVLLIARPGAGDFNAYAILALACVGFVTLRDLMARQLSRAVPTTLVALVTAVAVTLFAAAGLPFSGWVPVTGHHTALLAGAAAFLFVGYLAAIASMRVGDIAVVAPFRYSSLLWAILLGFLVFGEVPDALTLTGAAIIVATGIYTFLRERRLARA